MTQPRRESEIRAGKKEQENEINEIFTMRQRDSKLFTKTLGSNIGLLRI